MQKLYSYFLALAGALAPFFTHAAHVEVLHWWTSGGEAKAAQQLIHQLEQQDIHWKDFAVAGGGGESAMMVLKTRAISGNPPTAAQIKGHEIQEWASLGFLSPLNLVAKEQDWQEILPPSIYQSMLYQGDVVAVPINIHRVNWLWINPKIFTHAKVAIPHTLDELFTAAEQLQAAGYLPLAHGGQAWQTATLFEILALDILGVEHYLKAFVEHDQDYLQSPEMQKVFTTLRRLKPYMGTQIQGRSWNHATQLLIQDQAAMQLTGDWVKGELSAANKQYAEDYLCIPAFNNSQAFIYNVDSFVMFDLGLANHRTQLQLAATILSPELQLNFNRLKGSIPIRQDLVLTDFDACAIHAQQSFIAANESQQLVPSMSQGMATGSYVQGAIYEVVHDFFNKSDISAEQAVNNLTRVIRVAQ